MQINASSVEASMPGEPDRWKLPEDTSGLGDVTRMLSHINTMYDVITAYTFMQGVILIMFIVRLIHLISFQPKLSLISGTLARFIPDVFNFLVVFFTCGIIYSAFVCLVFGFRLKEVSDLGASITQMLKFLITGDDSGAVQGWRRFYAFKSSFVGCFVISVASTDAVHY